MVRPNIFCQGGIETHIGTIFFFSVTPRNFCLDFGELRVASSYFQRAIGPGQTPLHLNSFVLNSFKVFMLVFSIRQLYQALTALNSEASETRITRSLELHAASRGCLGCQKGMLVIRFPFSAMPALRNFNEAELCRNKVEHRLEVILQ